MSGSTFETLLALEAKWAAAGVPPLGAWWRELLQRWYAHPTARVLAVCAGRASAKSTSLIKVGINEILFGAFAIPSGERHSAIIASRLKDEASKSIGLASHLLQVAGVRHAATDGLITLTDLPRDIRIAASSVAANSGWRGFFSGADEVGKWQTDRALGSDAREVLSSQAAMLATHANARRMIVSSAFLDDGPFFEAVTAGSNERQLVAHAATWEATDGRISEAQTHLLEPNARVHAREYASVFSSGWEGGYFDGLIEASTATWTKRPYSRGTTYTVAIDPAFTRDLFAIAVCHREGDCVVVDQVEAITPPRDGSGLEPTACLRRVRAVREAFGGGKVLTDQHHAASLVDLAGRERVRLEPIAWTATSKSERFETMRTLMREAPSRLLLPNDPALLRELAGIGTKLLPSGHESVQARAGYTDDRVSAVVLGVSATMSNKPGSRMLRALNAANARDRDQDFRTMNAAAARLGISITDDPDFARLKRLLP